MMTEDGLYIGIVESRSSRSHADVIIVYPLMEWDEEENIWKDIDKEQSFEIFPDQGKIVSFGNIIVLSKNQVFKFKVRKNNGYIKGDRSHHAKFSVDRDNFWLLWELLPLEPSGSISDFRDAILEGNLTYDGPHNSDCLILINEKEGIGPLRFSVDDLDNRLVLIDPEKWHDFGVIQNRWRL
ncbi:hypothetical protein CCP3SC15_160019 [Gammaproteobacteria bacterium]